MGKNRCSFHNRQKEKEKVLVEFDILNTLKEEGGGFGGWVGNYKNQTSKFKWVCSEGHSCTTKALSFLRMGTRCITCFENNNPFGFKQKRALEIDNLYIVELSSKDETFIKIGRSFNAEERFKEYKRHYRVNLIYSAPSTHEVVWEAEQTLHSIFDYFHYTPIISFGGSVYECFDPCILNTLDSSLLDNV